MKRSLFLTITLLLAAAGSATAQAAAAEEGDPAAGQLVISVGPLATGSITQGQTVGHIGLFRSDLPRAVASSPEAERYAHLFSRDVAIARPFLLVGAALAVGGLAACVDRHGQLGMGAREAAAFGAGSVAFMYGADRLSASRDALRAAADAYNRAATQR